MEELVIESSEQYKKLKVWIIRNGKGLVTNYGEGGGLQNGRGGHVKFYP